MAKAFKQAVLIPDLQNVFKQYIQACSKRNSVASINSFYTFFNTHAVNQKKANSINLNSNVVGYWQRTRSKSGNIIRRYQRAYECILTFKRQILTFNIDQLQTSEGNLKWLLEREYKETYNIPYILKQLENETILTNANLTKYTFNTNSNESGIVLANVEHEK